MSHAGESLAGDDAAVQATDASRGAQPDRARPPAWLSLMRTTGMLLVAFGLPGAPFAVLGLYVEGTLSWPEAVRAGCWLIAAVALLGTALWIAASHLERGARAPSPTHPG